jgi:hypothetical protein
VFMRAFSSLVVALVVAQHRAHPFLTAQAVGETHRAMVAYLSRERDLRGWVPGKGWAHAVAHAADALDELALCPELGERSLADLLQSVRATVTGAHVVFADEEDERLVTPVISVIRRQVLSKACVSEWLSGFAVLEQPAAYADRVKKATNLKHFLRSLHFRAHYAGIDEWFEPVLSQALREVSGCGY